MDRREEATDFIRFYIWSGGYDAEDVFDIINDQVFFEAEGEDDDWLRGEIEREFQKKTAAEADWPETTDCDRLDRGFEALNAEGILARHKAGYTQQDGLAVAEGLYAEAGGDGRASVIATDADLARAKTASVAHTGSRF